MAISQVDLMRKISNGEENDGKKPSGGAKKRHTVIRENYRQYFGGSDKTGDNADRPSVDKAVSLTRSDGDPDMAYSAFTVQEGVYLWDVVESAVADRIMARNNDNKGDNNIFVNAKETRLGQTNKDQVDDKDGKVIKEFDQLADTNLESNRDFQGAVGTLVAELKKGGVKSWRAGAEVDLSKVLNNDHLDEIINKRAKLEIKA